MKAMVLNGAREAGDATDRVGRTLGEVLRHHGYQVDATALRGVELADCLGCFGCWVRTPGVCVINDAARDIARRSVQSDLLVLLSPVTFGGYGYHLKKAVDRMIGIASPFFSRIGSETHHRPRYEQYPWLLGVGVQAEPDEESRRLFQSLVNRNAINLLTASRASGIVPAEADADAVRRQLENLLAELGVAA